MKSNNWLKDEKELLGAKIATVLSGLFFILLELYWVTLFWWSRPARSHLPLRKRDFTPLGFLWWLLSLYFIAITISLTTEVVRKFDVIFGSRSEPVPDTGSRSETVETRSETVGDTWMIKAAFVSMLVCLYGYVALFLIMKLEDVVADKWKRVKDLVNNTG